MFLLGLTASVHAQQQEHVVQRGEDFASIARKYAITEQELKNANPTVKECYIGRKLNIPQHGVPFEQKTTPKPLDIELLSSDDDILTKSSATTYQVGQALWKKGNYNGAMAYLHAAAHNGEKRAYFPLGDCYAQDSAQCYNIDKAVVLFQQAIAETKNKSDEGYWKSCGRLADLYFQGKGVNKDLSQAKRLSLECKRYADSDGKRSADHLLNRIMAEEKAIAEKAAEERRALAAQKAAEKKAQAEKRARQAQAASSQSSLARREQSQVHYQSSVAQNQTQASQQTQSSSRSLEPYTISIGMVEMTTYPQPDGSARTYSKTPCVYCHGTKMCSTCVYSSMVQSAVSYTFICPMCGGTRMCLKCQGKGYTESWGFIDSNGVGFSASDQGNIVTTGDVQAAKSQRSSSSSSSSRGSSRSSGSCSRCHGKGIDPTPNSGGSLSSFVGYYNSAGDRCPYCSNNYTSHYHDRCHSCNVPTY